MAVDDLSDPAGVAEFWGERTPDSCFYCGQPIEAGPVPVWHGHPDPIAFHVDCAIDFAARLIRDALNATALRDGKDALGGIPTKYRDKK